MYEYCITMSEEVKFLAGRPMTAGIAVFLVNRYATLLNRLARLVQFVNWSDYSEAEADQVSIESLF